MVTLLKLCPEIVLHRYLAVTSLDSGVRELTSEERDAGWRMRGEVAYSPLIESLDSLYYQRDGLEFPGYDEWYVFDAPRAIEGEIFHGNLFEFDPAAGQLLVFVNFFAFVLYDPAPEIQAILHPFWKQLERIQPESYIADGKDCLTVVGKSKKLIDAAAARLADFV